MEVLRSVMIKVMSLKLCEMARHGKCKNGFFLPCRSDSTKCKDCQRRMKREKNSERITAQRILKKQIKQKKTVKTVKQKLNRAEIKVFYYIIIFQERRFVDQKKILNAKKLVCCLRVKLIVFNQNHFFRYFLDQKCQFSSFFVD